MQNRPRRPAVGRRAAAMTALLFSTACGDAISAGSSAEAGVPDAEAGDALRPPLDARVDEPDTGARPRGFGEPCEADAECLAGFCIEGLEAGRICTQLCGDCPEGYECTLIGNTGADRINVCTVDRPDLCKPCQTDRECDDTEDLCLEIGNGTYCGEDCAADGLCPEGYVCTDVFEADRVTPRGRQCVPAGGEGCLPCRDGDGDGFGDGGDCLGADCDDTDATVYTGAPERCDGRDNNCNSLADELELLQVPVDLPACLDRGVCAGTPQRCQSGTWACAYPGTYEADETTCDLLDNDCDGAVDEAFDLGIDASNCGLCGRVCTFPNAAALCVGGECHPGQCEAGWHDADGNAGNGCEYLCLPSPDAIETCNGADDDCDGDVDEGFDGGERCDGVDNDCDDAVDEGYDVATDARNCGACGVVCESPHRAGVCEGAACRGACEPGWHDVDGDAADGCEYGCFPSNDGLERCDLIDNDCDGAVDEETDLANDPDHCGACGARCELLHAVSSCVAGACRVERCEDGFADGDGDPGTGCEYRCTPFNGGVEICNGADDDCDLQIDEGIDLLTDPANCGRCDHRCALDNAVGRCLEGGCIITECLGGFSDLDGLTENGCEFGCFVSNGGVEACDGVDNDCDGQTDETFDRETDPENCGFCGTRCERPGAIVGCVSGQCVFEACIDGRVDLDGVAENGCEYACTAQNGGAEVCNFADDDCDGQVDEGQRNRCNGCGPEPAETCNGVDDDCNGVIDDGGACGPFIQQACRWFVGWSDENRGPVGVSNAWGECPFNADKWYGDRIRCVGTRRDGLFMQLDLAGDVDDNDRLAFAFLCDDPGAPALADYVQTHCAVYLGYADENRGPDGTQSWGQCPPALNWDNDGLRCTSSGYDRTFRKINLEGDVDANDDLAIAFKCSDPADPGRAAALQQSVALFMGWADSNRGPGDGAAGWGPCPGALAGEANGQRCTSTMGDGLFHRLDFGGDVNGDDDLGFALRARAIP
ncbi:putative metal-binding motif-containing protein [Myxococcota bacterium]|nr:putative metal-binding motif-containing protein [Myxococcota bacterium]